MVGRWALAGAIGLALGAAPATWAQSERLIGVWIHEADNGLVHTWRFDAAGGMNWLVSGGEDGPGFTPLVYRVDEAEDDRLPALTLLGFTDAQRRGLALQGVYRRDGDTLTVAFAYGAIEEEVRPDALDDGAWVFVMRERRRPDDGEDAAGDDEAGAEDADADDEAADTDG